MDDSDGKIEFLCQPGLADAIPAPARAGKFIPDWYRSLEREMGMPTKEGLPGLTAKACLPMADAFGLGFVIPLPVTVRLLIPEDRVNIRMGWAADAPFQPVETHHPGQIGAPEPPFQQVMPLKFINPWRIKVPEGYSVLFTQPFNHAELPFSCFTGLVDCDRFHTTVNFPFQWTGPAGDFTLPAGMPIAQLVPIRRDTLLRDHEARGASESELAEQNEANRMKYTEISSYAREWRTRK
ncbi:hypothetical protein [Aquisalinus flavus]|uniref:Uncharacterized protein n=1 Tax=Aquisalinus flavus TaxID=1526572 RepID=A0A8J2Y5S7_9PROT|nr:hypothetical protein [Aquisalinus flavus]MBD0427470.1 hypothetical protein [Aquisalinus flavus]UNE47269.1 hypothetical protein FF099_03945 [Aquisalinus flavus]GGD01257.1 hypothetical protein GCM10011342_07830 [Aquisalinus flavus]